MNRQDFLQYITVRKGLSHNSVRLCVGKFDLITKYLHENQQELTKESIESFLFTLKQKGYRNTSINAYLFALQYIQDYLKDRGSDNNFYQFNMLPKQKSAIIVLTVEEIKRIIDSTLEYGKYRKYSSEYTTQYCNSLNSDFTMFLAFTGCRFSEAAQLKIKYLDLGNGIATFIETKNKEIRYANFTEPLISRLQARVQGRSSEDYVFLSLAGNYMHPTTYIDDLHKRAKKVGITKRVHPHLFRHSFATELLVRGVGLEMVASLLGHKDIQTTFSTYAHIAQAILRRESMKHPLMRENINPYERIDNAIAATEAEELHNDPRFDYLKIKEAYAVYQKHLQMAIKPQYAPQYPVI